MDPWTIRSTLGMVLEVSQLVNAPVVTTTGTKMAVVDKIIFDGQAVKVAGFQVKQRAVLRKSSALDYNEVLSCERQAVIVDDKQKFDSNLKPLNDLYERFGSILGVTAKTESGEKIGKVKDLLIEVDTGLVVRFYIGSILRERIIPRQFLVAISPKTVVFKDVINQPTFDQIATAEVSAEVAV